MSLGYGGRVTVTRPANATPYTANDVLGGVITFSEMGPSGQNIMITSASLQANLTAVVSGMTTWRLHLYDVTPPSALADNAPFDVPAGDQASYLGYLELGTLVDLGSTLYIATDAINRQRKLAGEHLYGYLVTVGGFTPAANSEVYVVGLNSVAL